MQGRRRTNGIVRNDAHQVAVYPRIPRPPRQSPPLFSAIGSREGPVARLAGLCRFHGRLPSRAHWRDSSAEADRRGADRRGNCAGACRSRLLFRPPFKTLATETQRTRRNILENLREAHGEKRIYRTDQHGRRVPVLNRGHVQRMVNQKSNTPFGQRNFLNTIRAMFKWAVSEDRVPDDPTLGVTRQKIESTGYRTWEDRHIAQYKQKHALGTMERLAIELLLTTAARRGDVVKLGPQHIHEGAITFEQSKTNGSEKATVTVPLHPDFCAALKAMPRANVIRLIADTTFLKTSFGQPFTPAGFGNWFRQCCNEAGIPKGLSARTVYANRRRGGLPRWDARRTRLLRSLGTPAFPRCNVTPKPRTENASRRKL
jgi:integrase